MPRTADRISLAPKSPMSVSGLSLSGTVIPAGVDHRLILSFAAIEGHWWWRIVSCIQFGVTHDDCDHYRKGRQAVYRKIRTLIQTYAIVLLFAHWNACILRVIYEGSSGKSPAGISERDRTLKREPIQQLI